MSDCQHWSGCIHVTERCASAIRCLEAERDALQARCVALTEALRLVVDSLEATRWNPTGYLNDWANTPDGLNHSRVMLGLNTARAALKEVES